MLKKELSICVVIKVYNEFELLENCIKSINRQKIKPRKVIIVDDGSPNPKVSEEILHLSKEYSDLNIQLLKLPLKPKPDLDTVGRTWREAWFKVKNDVLCDYFGMLDSDTQLESNYYELIVSEMERNPKIACASGVFKIQTDIDEYVEEINIGAKIGRKDARGSGKVIRTSFLSEVEGDFPEVDWDTWINTKAKVRGFKSPQIDNVYMYQERPTSRVVGKDLFRNGRLTYHFGYNPALLLLKMLLAKRGALSILRGYLDARKQKWRLTDQEVRKYFGWGFFLHY